MFIIQRVKFLTSVRVSKSLHKTFFNLLKKEHNLIPHPTLGNAEYAKFNSSNISDSSTTSYSDNTLDFIKLDRKGKPIIQKTYYESLGVQQNSTKAMIKQNFIQIARRFHPDKHPDSLEFFSHVCVAYETLMDDYKRAAYDDDLLNNSDALFYVKVWKFRINVIYLFIFSVLFFSSKYILDFYNSKVKVNYACPLGEDKFNVDELKYNENNLKMLEFIDTSREILDGESTKKIAEDDEYEYYVKS